MRSLGSKDLDPGSNESNLSFAWYVDTILQFLPSLSLFLVGSFVSLGHTMEIERSKPEKFRTPWVYTFGLHLNGYLWKDLVKWCWFELCRNDGDRRTKTWQRWWYGIYAQYILILVIIMIPKHSDSHIKFWFFWAFQACLFPLCHFKQPNFYTFHIPYAPCTEHLFA